MAKRTKRKTRPSKAEKDLIAAIKAKDTGRVRGLLAEGVDVSQKDFGETAMLHAFESRCEGELILALLEAGADPATARDSIIRVVRIGRADILSRVLDAGGDVNFSSPSGTPLSVAASMGSTGMIKVLLDRDADVNAGNMLSTPFGAALKANHDEAAAMLLRAVADVQEGQLAEIVFRGMDVTLKAALARGDLDINERATAKDIDQGTVKTAVSEWAGQVFGGDESGSGREGAVVSLHVDNADITVTNYANATPLIVAGLKGNLVATRALIEAGANLDDFDDSGKTALMYARELGHTDVAAALSNAGAAAEPDVPSEKRIFLAVDAGDVETVRRLLDEGLDPNIRDKRDGRENDTALIAAARSGRVDTLRVLLDKGAEVNATNGDGMELSEYYWGEPKGRTALLVGVAAGHLDVVAALVAAGTDLSIADQDDRSALEVAITSNRAELIRPLVEAGCDVNKLAGSETPLTLAINRVQGGPLDTVVALIDAGADVNRVAHGGWTPLMGAVLRGEEALAALLVKAGADPTARTKDGDTPTKWAKHGSASLQKLIGDAVSRWRKSGKKTAVPKKASGKKKPAVKPAKKAKKKRTGKGAETWKPIKPVALRGVKKYEPDRVLSRLRRAASKSGFRKRVDELGDRLKAKPIDKTRDLGGWTVHVKWGKKLDLCALQEEFLGKGVFVYCVERAGASRSPGRLAILPTTDLYDAIAAMRTDGANCDLGTLDVIAWLKSLEKRHPFHVEEIRHDLIAGRFAGALGTPAGLAQDMYTFCPDIVDQGVETVEALAKELETSGRLYFWWD